MLIYSLKINRDWVYFFDGTLCEGCVRDGVGSMMGEEKV